MLCLRLDDAELAALNDADCLGAFKRPGTYGDVIHLRLLAMLLNTNFKVYVQDDDYWADVNPLIDMGIAPVSSKTIYLMLVKTRQGEWSGHYKLLMNIRPRHGVKVR